MEAATVAKLSAITEASTKSVVQERSAGGAREAAIETRIAAEAAGEMASADVRAAEAVSGETAYVAATKRGVTTAE